MKLRIWKKKLNLYKYLEQLDIGSLAGLIFLEQTRLSLPGLVKECENIAHEMNIYDELKNMNQKVFKKFINKKIIEYNEKVLKSEIESKDYKKLNIS